MWAHEVRFQHRFDCEFTKISYILRQHFAIKTDTCSRSAYPIVKLNSVPLNSMRKGRYFLCVSTFLNWLFDLFNSNKLLLFICDRTIQVLNQQNIFTYIYTSSTGGCPHWYYTPNVWSVLSIALTIQMKSERERTHKKCQSFSSHRIHTNRKCENRQNRIKLRRRKKKTVREDCEHVAVYFSVPKKTLCAQQYTCEYFGHVAIVYLDRATLMKTTHLLTSRSVNTEIASREYNWIIVVRVIDMRQSKHHNHIYMSIRILTENKKTTNLIGHNISKRE